MSADPNDREWTLRAESGVWRVETGAGSPYTLGEKVVAVPKDALDAMRQRAELAEAFHDVAVKERDAERRKAQRAEGTSALLYLMALRLKHDRTPTTGDDWLVLRVRGRPSLSGWSGSIAWLRIGSRVLHLGNWSKR